MNNSEIRCLLDDKVNKGIRVIIYDHSDPSLLFVMSDILDKQGCSNLEIWHRNDDTPDDRCLKKITSEQMDEVLKMYRLYDFSDRVSVIGESGNYGSLFNYVNTGILSEKELAEALLYGI